MKQAITGRDSVTCPVNCGTISMEEICMKTSANEFPGAIQSIVNGAADTQFINHECPKGLGLEAEMTACSHIKASQIVLAVEE